MHELVPIGLVAHHSFCPRRAWLEAVGKHRHAPDGGRHRGPNAGRRPTGSRSRRYRAVDVISHDLGVVGRCDIVELDENAAMTVILTMLRPKVVAAEELTFSVRTRRPARDPINAALNLCYGLQSLDVIGRSPTITDHEPAIL